MFRIGSETVRLQPSAKAFHPRPAKGGLGRGQGGRPSDDRSERARGVDRQGTPGSRPREQAVEMDCAIQHSTVQKHFMSRPRLWLQSL
jgi:hypothetical protein